jgi:hypothetical protein
MCNQLTITKSGGFLLLSGCVASTAVEFEAQPIILAITSLEICSVGALQGFHHDA